MALRSIVGCLGEASCCTADMREHTGLQIPWRMNRAPGFMAWELDLCGNFRGTCCRLQERTRTNFGWWRVCPSALFLGPTGDGPTEWPSPSLPPEAPFTVPDPWGAGVADPAALLEGLEGSEGGVWWHRPVIWWRGWVSVGTWSSWDVGFTPAACCSVGASGSHLFPVKEAIPIVSLGGRWMMGLRTP